MYLIVTRSFPPELGGMQSLMWGLSRELSKNYMIKVFADYIENHKSFDEQASFSIERVGGPKLLRKYRKAYLIDEFVKGNKVEGIIADHWKSLEHLKIKYPDVNCVYSLNSVEKFDLIIVSNVIHHVKSTERSDLFQKIYNLLDDNGRLLIYEHNPYNPITLKVVANCEFDIDAELINKKNLIKLCSENNFQLQKSGYIHFFPSKLKILFNLEKYLKWFFLGAQYFCIFSKK